MVKLLKRTLPVLVMSCCLLVVMTYHSFQLIFSSKKSNTAVFRHSSVLQDERISESIEKRQPNSVVTIDRTLLDYLKFHLSAAPYPGVLNYIRYTRAVLGLKELTDAKAMIPNIGPIINDVTMFEYPITITPCGRKVGKKNLRSVFISVMSTSNHFEQRSIIRHTWVTHLKNQSNVEKQLDVFAFGFVVGLTNDKLVQKKMRQESELHGDILQVSVDEEHGKLPVKTAGLLNWVHMNCPQVDYLLKTDDDVYVNVHNLATVLYAFSPSAPIIYGRPTGRRVPLRNDTEWPISFDSWPWSSVPRYLHGGGFLIAGNALRTLLAAIQTTPYFRKDDVYLTGLCAEKAGLQLRTSFRMFVDQSETYPDPCFIRSNVMWSSKSEDHMNTSQLVTKDFYRNAIKTKCVLTTYALHPNETLGMIVGRKISTSAALQEFHFKSVTH